MLGPSTVLTSMRPFNPNRMISTISSGISFKLRRVLRIKPKMFCSVSSSGVTSLAVISDAADSIASLRAFPTVCNMGRGRLSRCINVVAECGPMTGLVEKTLVNALFEGLSIRFNAAAATVSSCKCNMSKGERIAQVWGHFQLTRVSQNQCHLRDRLLFILFSILCLIIIFTKCQ
eukprot:NODE_399_length_8099_cov_0.731375.p7 type:complete len:175 gc:universal NODE_399_length_8099_cov_0.731375:273-797(+)